MPSSVPRKDSCVCAIPPPSTAPAAPPFYMINYYMNTSTYPWKEGATRARGDEPARGWLPTGRHSFSKTLARTSHEQKA